MFHSFKRYKNASRKEKIVNYVQTKKDTKKSIKNYKTKFIIFEFLIPKKINKKKRKTMNRNMSEVATAWICVRIIITITIIMIMIEKIYY